MHLSLSPSPCIYIYIYTHTYVVPPLLRRRTSLNDCGTSLFHSGNLAGGLYTYIYIYIYIYILYTQL